MKALDGVSLEVRQGRVTGLIGPDGAGKTTLMRLMCGLLPARPRDSFACSASMSARSPLKVQEALRYMPQRFGLYEDLTVQENLELYADLQGVPPAERPGRYRRADAHDRTRSLHPARWPGALSGGMKQKLGLACTLVPPPRLLLLDEPTVGVDPVSRRELWAIVYRLVDEGGDDRAAEHGLSRRGRAVPGGGPHARGKSPRAGGARRSSAGRSRGAPSRSPRPNSTSGPCRPAWPRPPESPTPPSTAKGCDWCMERPGVPDEEALLPGSPRSRSSPVAPRFEDSFVALLREKAGSPSPPAGGDGPRAHGGRRGGSHPGGERQAPFRRFLRRQGDLLLRSPGGGLRAARGQRRRQVDHLPDALRTASRLGRQAAGGRSGPAHRGGRGPGAHRVHGAEFLPLRRPLRAGKPPLLQQRLRALRQGTAGPDRLGAAGIRTRPHGRGPPAGAAPRLQAAPGSGRGPDASPRTSSFSTSRPRESTPWRGASSGSVSAPWPSRG